MRRYHKPAWMEIQDLQSVLFALAVLFLAVILLFGFSACGRITAPGHYVPAENFGNSGATRCETRQIIEADLQPCN